MKFFFLFLFFACTSAPHKSSFRYSETVEHDECFAKLESEKHHRQQIRIQDTIVQTTGTTGSVIVTGFGVISDTVVLAPGVAGTILLCSKMPDLRCPGMIVHYSSFMNRLGLLWTTEKIFESTYSWRCPNVDQISKIYREVTTCLHNNKEYVAAFGQLAILESEHLLQECISEYERDEWNKLKKTLMFPEL